MVRTALLGLVVALSSYCQEKPVDDPEFKDWAGFKPGSWVLIEQPWGKNGWRQDTEKLISKDSDKVVVELTKVEDGFQYPACERSILAKLEPRAGPLYHVTRNPEGGEHKFDGPGGKTTYSWRKSAEGDEEIEVAGKKLRCHWVTMEYRTQCGFKLMNDRTITKTWTSDEIPGRVAKAEITRHLEEPPETVKVTRIVKAWKKE